MRRGRVRGWRFLNTPLGDNHFGRVGGRYALHVRNLFADGLIGSSWSANWKPYVSVPYAHHPPLLNMLDAAVSGLPGDDPYQVMLAPHLLALLAIPAGAARYCERSASAGSRRSCRSGR